VEECFHDGMSFEVPQTHMMAAATSLRIPMKFDPAFDPRRTELLSRMVPLLRPGSIVLVDTSKNRIEDGAWTTEHDRPMYFVDVRQGYRCGWFHQDGGRLVMQPHALSHCPPEAWRTPEEAELVGQVAGIVTRLNGWTYTARGEFPEESEDERETAA